MPMLRNLFSRSRSNLFQFVHVNLGRSVIALPIADIKGNQPGKTLVVTGGMDGDEYAGIEAAYQLAEKYRAGTFSGRLIIIPILNLPGFEAEQSWNPLDHTFPKYIFPGRADGSATERLIRWLHETYLTHADVWYDAHSGALTERLFPFVWTYKTGVKHIDDFTKQLHGMIEAKTIVFEPSARSSKASQLARGNCVYILGESGERGNCHNEDVERHLGWMQSVMQAREMIDIPQTQNAKAPLVLQDVSFICAPYDGLWRAEEIMSSELKKGQVLGQCSRLDMSSQKELRIPTTGTMLWWKETLHMKRGDILCAWGK